MTNTSITGFQRARRLAAEKKEQELKQAEESTVKTKAKKAVPDSPAIKPFILEDN